MRSRSPVNVGARRRYPAGILALAAILFGNSGCRISGCDASTEANPPELFRGGFSDGVSYESAGPGQPFLPYPGGKQWVFEHRLGHAPLQIVAYLSFFEKGGDMAAGAGDLVDIPCWDDRVIVLHNNSCSDYFVRLTATGVGDRLRPPTRCEIDAKLGVSASPDASE